MITYYRRGALTLKTTREAIPTLLPSDTPFYLVVEAKLKASQDTVINVPNLERFIEDFQKKLPNLDLEGKRLALDMLGITAYLDGENLERTGMISPE